jgi:replicative DNA helicase
LVTLTDDLERRGQLTQVGGSAYLTGLINATPTSIHVEFYARIVERTAVLRRLIDAAGQIARLAYEDTEDASEVLDRAEEIIFSVAARQVDRDLRPIINVRINTSTGLSIYASIRAKWSASRRAWPIWINYWGACNART